MTNSKVSVAIITRNRAQALSRLLTSLVNQSTRPKEVLIIDNSSTDNTKRVVKSFSHQVTNLRYVLEKQIGIPHARNRALREAKGRIIAFIDDDCEAPDNWVKKIESAHKRYPGAAIQGATTFLPNDGVFATVTQRTNQKWLQLNTYKKNHLLVLDTRNASLKLDIVRKLNVQFDHIFYRGSDVDFGKQLLDKNQEIIFEPTIINFHWERANILSFMRQKYEQGKSRARSRSKWGTIFAPRRSEKESTVKDSSILIRIVSYLRLVAYTKGYKDQLKKTPPLSFLLSDRLLEFKTRYRKITVGIITRNRAASLRRCLTSLLKQTRKIDKVLIVNNDSKDKTKNIVESFRNKLNIHYVVEKEIGIPYARNRALKEAHGGIFTFLDDDCEVPADWIENIQKFHSRFPQAVAIQGWSNSLPKKWPISIISRHNRELFLKNHIENPILKRKLAHPKVFRKALDLNKCFRIKALDTKNASFKLDKLRELNVSFDTNFIRGSDVDFGKQISAKGGEIILCLGLSVNHWERGNAVDFLIQRFGASSGSTRNRKKWKYGQSPTGIGLYRRIRTFLRYLRSEKIDFKLRPILLLLFVADKLFTFFGHFFQRSQFTKEKVKKLDESAVLRGAAWLSSSDLLQKLIHFIIIASIASLGPFYVGIFHLSIRIFHFTENLLARILAVKFIPRLRSDLYVQKANAGAVTSEEIVGYSLKIYVQVSFAATFVALLSFIPIATYFNITRFPYFIFLTLAFPFAVVSSYIISLLRLFQKFREVLILQFGFALFAQIGLFIFLTQVLSLRLLAIGLAQFIAFGFAFIVGIIFVFPLLNPIAFIKKPNVKINPVRIRTIINFLSFGISRIIDIILIAILFGVTTLGFYTILLYLPLLVYSLATTSFGMFIHAAAIRREENKEIINLSKRVIKWMVIITLPIFTIIFLYPAQILSLIFHELYLQDIQIVRILAVACFIQSFSWFIGRILIVRRQIEEYIVSNLVFIMIIILGALTLSSGFGITGVALSILGASVIDFLLKLALLLKQAEISKLRLTSYSKQFEGVEVNYDN